MQRFLARTSATIFAISLLTATTIAQTPSAEEGAAAPPTLLSELNETIVKVPVTAISNYYGHTRDGEMTMTHFRPPGAGPFPIVIMNHGRGTNRAVPERFRYLNVARYWTRRGFAVVMPTRLGYGNTGLEPDPEESGPCSNKNYTFAATASAKQIGVTIEWAKTQPWANASRVIVMGQSMGGFATIAANGQNFPGVIAAINFAGGGGGDPVERFHNPCQASKLGEVFANAGKSAKAPMLWLYAENDKYWGADWPKKWHEAYVSAGGTAKFTMFPPEGEDGHALIGTGFRLWRPALDAFIATLGVTIPKSADAPSASNFAALEDASKVPLVKDEVKANGYKRFLSADIPRAFAIGPKGEWNFISGADAPTRALERCANTAKTACKLYAVDDAVVWAP
jgi:dienelactone hydrolase